MIKRSILALLLILIPASLPAAAGEWDKTVAESKGKTVYFNAWGGSREINNYIRWAGKELNKRFGIQLEHVKVTDISETVTRILAEKTAGRKSGGSVDLMWINGENFKAMKEAGLLHGPFTGELPSYGAADVEGLGLDQDFTVPVEGLEAPWGVGQLNFIHDADALAAPPKDAAALLIHAKAHPGRITYPKPPQFHGSSFMKQVLLEITPDRAALYKPMDKERFAAVTKPLWDYLDALHPVAWRKGNTFPRSSTHMKQLFNDGQLDLTISFNPQDAALGARNGTLPRGARAYAFEVGALTNCHFLAIPFNSDNSGAAKVVINFLMSPSAQARKADTKLWGDPPVLDLSKLSKAEKSLFDPSFRLLKGIAEPHPSWMTAIEKEWTERYGH